jgi:hypothetical protein
MKKICVIDGKEYNEVTVNRLNADGINEPYVYYEEI